MAVTNALRERRRHTKIGPKSPNYRRKHPDSANRRRAAVLNSIQDGSSVAVMNSTVSHISWRKNHLWQPNISRTVGQFGVDISNHCRRFSVYGGFELSLQSLQGRLNEYEY